MEGEQKELELFGNPTIFGRGYTPPSKEDPAEKRSSRQRFSLAAIQRNRGLVQFIRGVPFSSISQTHLSRAFLVNASRERLGFKDRNLNGFLSREKIKKEEVRSCLFDEDRFKKRQSVSKKGKETFVRLDILFFTMHYNFTFIRITPTALLNVLYDEIYFII